MLRSELHHETQRANSYCEETPAIEEQNGVVSDLLKNDSFNAPVPAPDSAQTATSPFCLSMQMSMHMQQIRSSFKRVSGFDNALEAGQPMQQHLRNSMDIVATEHFPSFADFSESYEEEADVNPWRESVIDDAVVKDVRKSWGEKKVEGEVEGSNEVKKDEEAKWKKDEEMQSMKKWLQSDVLLKRVFLLYDDIRNRRTFNITNEEAECVVRFEERSDR